MLEQLHDLGLAADVVACPVGGGGLLGGVALALHYASPATAIWAVEPEGYNGMGLSLSAGEMRRVPGATPTISDALQATAPGTAPLAAARKAGVRGVAVADGPVAHAMRFAFERLKLVLEPSGAVALAAVLDGQIPVHGKTVVIVATGGNVALGRFTALVGSE
jgi:threonine dehydratase